jgi:hypothetical protein
MFIADQAQVPSLEKPDDWLVKVGASGSRMGANPIGCSSR